jgi:hypothetical protein
MDHSDPPSGYMDKISALEHHLYPISESHGESRCVDDTSINDATAELPD